MFVELKINKTSNVINMSYCPKDTERFCGIQYRSM